MRRSFRLTIWPVSAVVLVLALATSPFFYKPVCAEPRPKAVSLETWTLKNGLNVVFAARQGAPLVSVQIVYHVGSRDEKPGTRGLARMMRELMFRGSARVAPGRHNQLMARIGARAGAQGDEDVTTFFDTVPAPYLSLALELEADRMRSLTFNEDAVTAVRQFVLNARQRQVDSSAMGKSVELLRGDVFGAHAYAYGVSGTLADLRRITIDDCQSFHRSYFTASNATLVVAGAASSKEVHRLVDALFGALPAVKRPETTVAFLPRSAADPKSLRLPIDRPMVAIAAPMPRLSPNEHATMLVLAEILGGGSAGRLATRLVGPRAPALAAGAGPMMLEDGGMWIFFAVHEPIHTSQEVRRALMDEIERVRDKPVELDELTESRLRAAALVASRLSTAEGLGSALGLSSVLMGSAEQALLLPQAILDVSQSDVGRVANQYLGEDMLSILMMTPEGRAVPTRGEP
jgi:zinc protease